MYQAAVTTDCPTFRRVLQDELARRCANNPQYSIRAFARDLDTDHSTLSQQLRGRRRLTDRSIAKFGETLGFSAAEIDAYVLAESRQPAAPASGDSVEVLRELTADTLAIITGFEHYAILELTHLDDFRPDVSWIARMLGLEPDAVNIAIQRLLRLGLLEMASSTKWVDCSGDVTHVLDGVAYEAVRRLSERARLHAIESERAAPANEREFSSTTIAVDRRRIPEALRILVAARNQILRLLSEGDQRDQVYQLDTSLLPLTRNHCEPKEQSTDE